MNRQQSTSLRSVILAGFIASAIFNVGCNKRLHFAYLKIGGERIYSFLADTTQTAFIVQNNSITAENSTTPIKLVSYTLKRTGGSREMPEANYTQLEAEADSIAHFVGNVIIGNNILRRESIKQAVTGDDNKTLQIKYLRLKPFVDQTNHLAYYLIPVLKIDSAAFVPKKPPVSDPCPPHPCYNVEISK